MLIAGALCLPLTYWPTRQGSLAISLAAFFERAEASLMKLSAPSLSVKIKHCLALVRTGRAQHLKDTEVTSHRTVEPDARKSGARGSP